MAEDIEDASEKPHGVPITRGAFLGAASVLAVTAASCDSRDPPPAQDPADEGRDTGSREPLDYPRLSWALPAGVLNALWADVFPRLVAKAWIHQHDYAWIWPGMTEAHLVESLWRFRAELGPAVAPSHQQVQAERRVELASSGQGIQWDSFRVQSLRSPLNLRNVPPGLDLRRKVQTIAEYFERDRSVRFNVSGSGGYDFLLSDWGVEFFIPTKPRSAADLMRYFSFRNTGRPAIGLPLYMESGMPSVAIDAPTGASQVFASPELMRERIRVEREAVEAHLDRPAVLERLRTLLPAPTSSARPGSSDEVSLRVYTCSQHDWQMEGTVYRAIMVELPRIVATAWMEKENNTDQGGHAYAARVWGRDEFVNGPQGFRTLFKERLETSISGGAAFRLQDSGSSEGSEDLWDGKDVMITDKGFFFPVPQKAPPSMDEMLLSIAEGNAGNPVFTDSKRPDRGG